MRNREDAQDAVQDAFLNAHRALHTFDRERVFYSWFYAILRNGCYKLLARRRMDAVDHGERRTYSNRQPCRLMIAWA
jgi:RNA polymerase sigma factor (sigma-70 family)